MKPQSSGRTLVILSRFSANLFKILAILAPWFSAIETQGQSLDVKITYPTCTTCCDGSMTLTVKDCPGGAALGSIYPVLNLTSFTLSSVLVFGGVCCDTYSVSMIGGAPCNNAQWLTVITIPCNSLGMEGQCLERNTCHLFPNPASNLISVGIDGNKRIMIFDSYGRLVWNRETADDNVDVSEICAGSYFVCVYSEKGDLLIREKLLKE